MDLQHFTAVEVAVEKEVPQPARRVRVDPAVAEQVEKLPMVLTQLQIPVAAEVERAVSTLVEMVAQAL